MIPFIVRRVTVLVCVCVVSVAIAHAQFVAVAPAPDTYASVIEASRAMIDSLLHARNIPGISIAVSVHGKVVWSEGFGYANLEYRLPVRTTTKFRVGSISKSLTAAALAKLYEAGRIDLDAPVQQYVPSFPEKRKGTVTTRQAAGHVAGIRHYRGTEFLSSRPYETVLSGLAIFQDDTLQTPPNTAYSYSTYG